MVEHVEALLPCWGTKSSEHRMPKITTDLGKPDPKTRVPGTKTHAVQCLSDIFRVIPQCS